MKSKRIIISFLKLIGKYSCLLIISGLQIFANEEVPTFAHDPCMIKEGKYYYLFSTNNMLMIRRSTDLVHWENTGNVLPQFPEWLHQSCDTSVHDIWAPDISYFNGKYHLYYCGSVWATNKSAIGLATNKTLDPNSPDYKWIDEGEIIRSEGTDYNAIDPSVVVDKNGTPWLSFGSFWSGIHIIKLDYSTGKRSSDRNIYQIASRNGGAIEGPSIIERNGYYYLFVSFDFCCQGEKSNYKTIVGRSNSITGPFVDRNGRDMKQGFGELYLESYGNFKGPGGGTAILDGSVYKYVHHLYGPIGNWLGRMHIRDIAWTDDGWPFSAQPYFGQHLSMEAEHAKVYNAEIRTSSASSNGSYVGMINFSDSRIRFSINVVAGSKYTMKVYYANGLNDATHNISINGGTPQVIKYPTTNNWGIFNSQQVAYVDVSLRPGSNFIDFTKGENYTELDRVELIINANSPTEAENYDFAFTAKNEVCSDGGLNVGYIKPEEIIRYENMDFGTGLNNLKLRLASNSNSSHVEIRVDNSTGPMIGSADITSSGGWQNWKDLDIKLDKTMGVHTVFFKFTGNAEYTTNLDWFKFYYTDPIITNTSEVSEEADFKIYPNPGNGLFYLKSEENQIKNIKIYDLSGNTVYQSMEKPDQIDLRFLSCGHYLVEYYQKGIKEQKYLVIQ